ncbi:6-hydroxymethylpterin diphosphokinase MptE-like protein [Vibrio coralliilyticus]|uniref:6-hydroxymethylpterin diphosphokinase MptE-like protein n=1 Tax=Vibrio coralliilyticus TaxID=190893 RepID=UPI0039175266
MSRVHKTKTEVISDFVFDILYTIFNIFRTLIFYINKTKGGYPRSLSSNKKYKNLYNGRECFVLGNGPSLKVQNIELLKDRTVFMVNRAFMDSRYAEIKPDFHVFVDQKLCDGRWPISYLDEVISVNPDVTLVLNARWYDVDKFQVYKTKCKIIWLDCYKEPTRFNVSSKVDISKISIGKHVVENAIITATYLGFKTVYVTGVDGDGFANLLVGMESHSYGFNEDDVVRFSSWQGIREALSSVCRWMIVWSYLDCFTKNNGTKIKNLTGRGIITMVELGEFSKVVEREDDKTAS